MIKTTISHVLTYTAPFLHRRTRQATTPTAEPSDEINCKFYNRKQQLPRQPLDRRRPMLYLTYATCHGTTTTTTVVRQSRRRGQQRHRPHPPTSPSPQCAHLHRLRTGPAAVGPSRSVPALAQLRLAALNLRSVTVAVAVKLVAAASAAAHGGSGSGGGGTVDVGLRPHRCSAMQRNRFPPRQLAVGLVSVEVAIVVSVALGPMMIKWLGGRRSMALSTVRRIGRTSAATVRRRRRRRRSVGFCVGSALI